MKSWTLINEFGDRIERITTKVDMRDLKGRTHFYSYRNFKLKSFGHLNKVKKAVNDFRGKKTTWKECWE